jgi:hypothetical protein
MLRRTSIGHKLIATNDKTLNSKGKRLMQNQSLVKTTIQLPQVSPELKAQYEQLLTGQRSYGKATETGIEIAGLVHSSLMGRIASWRLYLYKWGEGLSKQEFSIEETPESEIVALGLKRGVSFTFEAEGFSDRIAFDCPVSSFVGFSNYASALIARGLTLETVITKLSTTVRNFKMGSTPVLTFELIGPYGKASILDAEFTAKPAPQPSAQRAAVNSIPSAWQ